jgi:thioredoxin reductase
VEHAVISKDEVPGGMFRQYPLFQRLVTWTKPHALADRKGRDYERFDWNSLLAEESDARGLVSEFMDGTSYFPSRPEMHTGITEFADKTSIAIRYGCTWESTRLFEDGFVVQTTDGEYRTKLLVIAVGMTKPWKPTNIEGLENVPHYVDVKSPQDYASKKVFIIGKRNSGFEIADALLPWVRSMIIASPRPARFSVFVRSTAAARARYIQPYEDHVLGGGNLVLDASVPRIERREGGYLVHASGTTHPGEFALEMDEVIAATGFTTPLNDLPKLGVSTFYQERLPAQTPFWESASTPGIYFAGSITQGAIGLKKYGIPSNSAAVHGFRYNARVLAAHIAEHHFGKQREQKALRPNDLVEFLLSEATRAPELWNQQSYLARIVTLDESAGILDEGVWPLAHFVDSTGPDAVALTIETDDQGDIHPAVYVRRKGEVGEHLLESHPLHEFATKENRSLVSSVLQGFINR